MRSRNNLFCIIFISSLLYGQICQGGEVQISPGKSSLQYKKFSNDTDHKSKFFLPGKNPSDKELEKKLIHFLPVYSSQKEYAIAKYYSDQLMVKLYMSDVFEINDLRQMNSILENTKGIYQNVKRKVSEIADKSEYENVIYGYLTRQKSNYIIRLILYNAEGDKIISSFQDNIFGEEDCELSAKRCAVEFCSRMLSISSSRYFFGSMILPGLGQFLKKKYIKGAVFSGSFIYLFNHFLTTRIKFVGSQVFTSNMVLSGGFHYKYYISGKEYPYEEWSARKTEYEQYLRSKSDISDKKSKYAAGAAAVYLINIIDMLRTIKSYNNKRMIEKRLSLNAIPLKDGSVLSLTYNF